MLERLLDSVILIDHFNNIPEATTFISGLEPERTAVSVMSYAEILVGFDDEDAKMAKTLLNHYEVLHIDLTIAEKAAELRRQYGWKLPDAFQAALALHYHVKLCTRNTRDFNPKRYPFVKIPYQLRS